jgi:hypothetical protein
MHYSSVLWTLATRSITRFSFIPIGLVDAVYDTKAVALPAGFRTVNNGTDVLPFGVTLFADTLLSHDCELLDLAERYGADLAGEQG